MRLRVLKRKLSTQSETFGIGSVEAASRFSAEDFVRLLGDSAVAATTAVAPGLSLEAVGKYTAIKVLTN